MMTDTIADMLTRIRNAQMAHLAQVSLPLSKVKLAIAELLSREGYVGKVKTTQDKLPRLVVELKYEGNQPAIRSISRVSKPGHRAYRGASQLPVVLNGYGLAIVSTSRGIMTGIEAKAQGVGGEIICFVY